MGSCHSSTKGRRRGGNGSVDIVQFDGAATETSAEGHLASATTSFSSSSSSFNSKTSRKRWWKKKSAKDYGGGVGSGNVQEFEVSGRICSNGVSKIACLYTQQGKKGVNQDAMIVQENFSSKSDTVFCGVFDGHGPFGHMVSRKVRDTLPLLLSTQWTSKSNDDQSSLLKTRNSRSTNSEDSMALDVDDDCDKLLEAEENEKLPEMYLPLRGSILRAFQLMDKQLKIDPKIDCFCSGTTAVTLVKQGQDLVLGNVGDSRAVLATRDEDDSLMAIQLTVDLKPDLPGEAARIQQCKGRVFALQDEPEVARVWLPNNDSPGLAMARAFGDFCLKDFGLISVPDVYYRRLTARDQFVILATDGVWDVLSNKEAIEIVASAPTRETAAKALVDCAVRAWRLKYPTSKNDDCAVICLFLEYESTAMETEAGDMTIAQVDAIEVPANVDDNVKDIEAGEMTIAHEDAMEVLANADDKVKDMEVDSECRTTVLEGSVMLRSSNEIVPVCDEKVAGKGLNQSKRSLAECISAEEEEWSALEGITRVNSLLSLPRFLSGDKRPASWRKWR